MIDGHVEGHGNRAVIGSVWVPELHMLRCIKVQRVMCEGRGHGGRAEW
jgi:hypothetical protein